MNNQQQNILITGARGFLGSVLTGMLAEKASMNIAATSRRAGNTPDSRSAYVAGDLCDKEFCEQITKGQEIVVHCAALSSPWGSYADFEKANVTATRNLVDAAIANGVRRFIFISTPSIYFDHSNRYNIKETDPLPKRMINAYAATKLEAENYVLDLNGKGIETISLRPRAFIGAGDTTIFPRLIHAYGEHKLKIIGDGQVLCDVTCVKNVVAAVECAMHAGVDAMGLAYNISDGRPVVLWELINYLLTALGHSAISKQVPKGLAMGFAGFLEWKYRNFHKGKEPPLTRFGIGVLSTSMTMNIDRAKQLLNYQPKQTTEQGINEFIAWYKQQNDR